MLFVRRAMLLCCVLMTLLFCGACTQQRWNFAAPTPSGSLSRAALASSDTDTSSQTVAIPSQPTTPKPSLKAPSTSPRVLPCSTFPSQVGNNVQQQPTYQQAPVQQPYAAARPPAAQGWPSSGTSVCMNPTVQPLPSPGSIIGPCPSSLVSHTGTGSAPPCVEPLCNEEPIPYCEERSFFHPRSLWQDVCGDYRNYYTCPNLRGYLYAVAGGSLLANTSLDDDFRNWYQRDVRSTETDNFAAFWKTFGEGEYVVPFFACTAVAGKLLERFPVADTVGEHGYRTTRAYLVGVPPMIFSQYLLGGSRPDETPHTSMWRPFEDNNGVSGHSFMGAVPFITAAQMSECWFTRAGFYMLSTFPAWSRINDDAHYLSQTCLGWYMAYMACSSVNRTECSGRCFEVLPVCQPGGAGIMAIWKR